MSASTVACVAATVVRLLHGASAITRDQQRSLWLHRAVAGKVAIDPVRTFATARRNLVRLRAEHTCDRGCRPAAAPGLKRRAAEVDPFDPEVVDLAASLVETMRVSPACVGLAANQLGVARRVFYMYVTGHAKARTCHGLVVLANPVASPRRSRRSRARAA